MRVYRHALGDPWEKDGYVFGEGRAPEDWIGVDLSENGRWLLVNVQRGWVASDVYLRDLSAADGLFKTVVENRDAIYEPAFRGDTLFIRSNDGAPRYALSAVDAESPSYASRRVVVPEGEDILDAFALTRDRIVVAYLHNAHTRLKIFDDRGHASDVPLPPFGTVAGLSARESSPDAYILYTSFTQPPTVYTLDAVGGSLEVWNAITSPIDVSPYRVTQEWCRSADGTRIPLYVLSRAETPRDGTAPAVITGYGGFNVSYLPSYFSTLTPWLDAGGVYAIVNLRGGGEFGEAWHRAGMLHNKQHVFDDFIAATEFLGQSGYADPARIGIVGGSNGGLLTAAVTVQRPELFAAVVCEVPLCDMLRFPRFLIARLWTAEYGDPAKAEDFRVLHAYSPYHRVKDGTPYPAMFFRTAESDSRVDPLHARKMGARMQAATSSDRPILVQIEREAGHGAGKPRRKVVEDLADRWSFFAWALGKP
jgi:prolyl oligopeptidase